MCSQLSDHQLNLIGGGCKITCPCYAAFCGCKGDLAAPRCHPLSPLFPGFYSTTAPLPFSQVSAVYSQLSSAAEQVKQNPDLIQRNKVSGHIASSLAKSTDVEDNMFLPGNTSLLRRICENPCKHSPLHGAFP